MISVDSFIDELQKIAKEVELSPEEKRRQALQFAALGTATVPAMGALSSKMMTGKWMPKGVSPRRWLPAAAATGLFWGGALPTMQHMIARKNIRSAGNRVAAEREMQRLAPTGVAETLKSAPTTLKHAPGAPSIPEV
jgi:hypothetical protein